MLVTLVSLAVGFSACTFPMQPGGPTPGPSPTPKWVTYSNRAFGFSISHPPEFQTPADDYAEPYGFIGDQVYFNITETSPLDCRGDCPVIEASGPVQIAGRSAIRISGSIGAAGGNVPQQYLTYVFEKDNRYYTLTLYAVPGGSVTTNNESIQPLQAEDIQLFEQMLATFQFTS
jgi:hypothetical protein